MLLGKFFARQLGYFAETGRASELRDGFAFLRETVRRPSNLYPEWWFHHRPRELSGYIRDFLADHRDLWCAYTEDPEGDYTVDSGNCEQTAVFLQEMFDRILGVSFPGGGLRLQPVLPDGGGCGELPVGHGETISFRFDGTRLELQSGVTREMEIALPVWTRKPAAVIVNGRPVESRRIAGREFDTLRFICPPGEEAVSIMVKSGE